jgi:nitrile hydratase
MDGVHDMGGMHGFGPVPADDDGAPFPETWQGRVFATNLALAMQTGGNVDRFRFLIESMPPAEYLGASYYERWLASMLAAIERDGLLDSAQLEQIRAGVVPDVEPDNVEAVPPEIVGALVNAPAGASRDMSGEARFSAGDAVRARCLHPAGHIRLPRYVRGRRGVIVKDCGNQHLPDRRADSAELVPQRLYTVAFTARELWNADTPDTVRLDLWESYLEPG